MRYDGVDFENIKFCLLFTLSKTYLMSGDILKVHCVVKSLTLRLIKLDKNYSSYYLKSITAYSFFI